MVNAVQPRVENTGLSGRLINGSYVISLGRWALLLGGGALAVYGIKQKSPAGVALGALGTSIVLGGINSAPRTRDDASVRHKKGIRVVDAITVNRSPEQLYCFWRDLSQLPRFMKHLVSVDVIDARRSHWVAKGPLGNVEWNAEIINEIENELIAWRSVEDSDARNAGSVHFEPLSGDRGTRVTVVMQYEPPGGPIAALFAKLFGEEPGQQVSEDLRRFKQIAETGEIATTEGQPSGRLKTKVQA